MKLLFWGFLLWALQALFSNAWISGMVYSLYAVLQPKYVWPWSFPDISYSMILALCCIAGAGLAFARSEVDKTIFSYRQHWVLVFMLVLFKLSDFFSSFPVYFAGVKSDIIISTFTTVVILYFLQLAILSNKRYAMKALKWYMVMFVLVCVYYTYWANDHYLASNWGMFTQGRLNGPRGSPYGDQNALATLVVMGMPFLLLGFFYAQKRWLKWSCMMVLPLLWHALFLFGSRGSMLAVLASTLVALSMLKNTVNNDDPDGFKIKGVKFFKVMIVIGLVAALITQAGTLLNRSSDTLSRADSEEEVANPRILSWTTGLKIASEYPVLGAGPQRFQTASHHLFPGETPHVAHNTFINFSANTGFIMGFMFLYLFWLSYKNYHWCKEQGIDKHPFLEFMNKATGCSLVGFFVCAVFLDLIVFEAFYFMLMLNGIKLHIFKRDVLGWVDVEKHKMGKVV